MLRSIAPRALAILPAAAIAISVLSPPAAEAAGTRKETMWPITAADMLRDQAESQEDAGSHDGAERHAAALPGRRPGGLSAVPSCLPDRLKAALRQIEERWGKVEIISAHRPGARIRGSGRPSLHASCQAVDFRPPKGSFRAVAAWLKKTHAGGVGTYSGKRNHIHIDVRPCEPGKCYRWHR
jgi:uncharacterized protein YcbK (DUF882 family)